MTKQLLKTSALSLPSAYHFHPCITETTDSMDMDIAAGRSCVFPLPQITISEPPASLTCPQVVVQSQLWACTSSHVVKWM